MVAQFTPNGNLQNFDIRNFTDTLTPAKEKNKFICPNCEGHNLSVEPETGKYQCFNGCTNREVRESIRPWSEALEERKQGNYTQTHKPKTKPVPKTKPAPIPDILDIATIPNPTPPETITQGENAITTYKYSGTTKVVRTDNPHKKKTTFPYCLGNDGWVKGKGEGIEWPPYRLNEVVNFGKGKWALIVEGEQCTDIARVNFGIVTTTFQGGSWGENALTDGLQMIKNAGVAGVIVWPDHDNAGYKKAEKIADLAAKIQLPLIELNPLVLWDAMPEKGDIADFLGAHKNMTGDDLIAILKSAILSSKQIKNNLVAHPTLKASEELIKQIDLLISKDLARSELEAIIPDIAKQCDRYAADVWKLYNARIKEQEQLEDRKRTTKQLPTLLDAQKARLEPRELFWSDGGIFARTLMGMAENMPTAVEHLITTLIAAAGSRIGTSSRIIISPSAKYTQPAIFWTCIVAGTGQLKTPAQQAILSPLNRLEAEEYKAWKLENDDYKNSLDAYKKSKVQEAEPPEQPAPRKRFVVSSATSEARIKLHGENPRGFLNYRDEWSGFVNGRNKYRKGTGDDLEQDLSEFNGDALIKDLVKSEDSVFIEKSAISRTGNTQPETLKNLQSKNNFEDFQGEFSRWLFCLVDSKPAYIDLFKNDDGLGDELDNFLINLYRRLGELPERDYFLSFEAKQRFQYYQHQLINWTLEENHPGLKATYPKLQSYLARLALFLHLANAALVGATPDQMIGDYTMYAACKMVDFYLAQARLVYALNSPEQELAGNYLKVKTYIDKRGQATVRDIKVGVRAVKTLTTAEITSICDELVDQGVVVKKDRFYTSLSKDDNVDKMMTNYQKLKNNSNPYPVSNTAGLKNKDVDVVDAMMTPRQHPETITIQGLQDLADDNVDVFSDFCHQPENIAGEGLGLVVVDGVYIESVNRIDRAVPENPINQAVDTDDTPSTNVNRIDRAVPENPINQAVDTDDTPSTERQQSSTVSTKPKFEVRDNVLFYATFDHAERKKQTKGTIVDIEYEHGYLVQCQVEYIDKNGDRQIATIGGGSSEWLLRKVR
jgi:hypothetical protein